MWKPKDHHCHYSVFLPVYICQDWFSTRNNFIHWTQYSKCPGFPEVATWMHVVTLHSGIFTKEEGKWGLDGPRALAAGLHLELLTWQRIYKPLIWSIRPKKEDLWNRCCPQSRKHRHHSARPLRARPVGLKSIVGYSNNAIAGFPCEIKSMGNKPKRNQESNFFGLRSTSKYWTMSRESAFGSINPKPEFKITL